jgi:hypothetical protein
VTKKIAAASGRTGRRENNEGSRKEIGALTELDGRPATGGTCACACCRIKYDDFVAVSKPRRAGKHRSKINPTDRTLSEKNHQLDALGHCSCEKLDKKRRNMAGGNKLKTRNQMNCRRQLDLA